MRKALQGIGIVFIGIFLIISLTRSFFSYQDKVQFYQDLEAEHDEVLERNKNLKSDLQQSSDYFYVERQIRNELNLLQEDEISLIIPELTPTPTPQPSITPEPYQKWINLIIGTPQ